MPDGEPEGLMTLSTLEDYMSKFPGAEKWLVDLQMVLADFNDKRQEDYRG